MPNYGELNPALTKAIRELAKESSNVFLELPHAQDRMEEREIDHSQVLTCLRKGSAYGPEIVNRELRANVVHRGIKVRVVVAGLDDHEDDWSTLQQVLVITVMDA